MQAACGGRTYDAPATLGGDLSGHTLAHISAGGRRYGAARVAELAGDREKARIHYTQLMALAERADSERPELVQARAFLTQK